MYQPKKPNLRHFEKAVELYEKEPIETGKLLGRRSYQR